MNKNNFVIGLLTGLALAVLAILIIQPEPEVIPIVLLLGAILGGYLFGATGRVRGKARSTPTQKPPNPAP